VTAAAEVRPAAPGAAWLERAAAAYPLVLAYVVVLILTAWQTTRHATPWNFTDELKWAELSRSVAHHGHPQLRLADAPADSLYTYLIAPAWWLRDSGSAYAAAKYVNAVVMTATMFPAYGLARLFARRATALVAAVAAAVAPAVSYAVMLIPEPLAYFWSTLTLWLVARALLRTGRWSVLLAAAALVVAPFVRSQLAVLVAAAAVAVAVVAATSARGRAIARSWSWWDRAGGFVLLLGAAIVVDAYLANHSHTWQVGTYYGDRMLEYGLWAFGAFAIGIGVLPVVVALAWMLSARIASREDRVLLALLVGTALSFGLYTAVKASYISTVFAIRVEERNLIYLAPVVLAVTARWFDVGRARVAATAAAAAGVAYLLLTTPYHMDEHFSVDAPGLSILSWLNRTWYWTPTDAKRLLVSILAVSVAVLVAREVLARRQTALRRWRAPAAALLALLFVLVVGWNATGEITAANASNSFASDFRKPLPDPEDFVDRTTGGDRTLFIGQHLANSNLLWSLEFWNRSIEDVWSVDASAPPPGPTVTPNLAHVDGTLDPQPPVRWAVTLGDVAVVGHVVRTEKGLHLVRIAPPLRLEREVNGVTPDGWMGTHSWFAQFAGRPGTAVVSLSRSAACGDVPPAHVTVRVGRVAIDVNSQPAPGRLVHLERTTIRSTPCTTRTIRVPVRPPFRVDVTADRTFRPSQYDPRDLSVQVAYGFEPLD
jgi:hypothetical protein